MRKIQFFGSVLFGALLYGLDVYSSSLAGIICLLLILFFGVPHGAVDHKIHQSTSKNRSLVRYVITYLVIAGGYVLWWILDPAKALFIFILLSSYHFGQEMLEDRKVKSSQSVLAAMIWGSAILIGPIFFSLDEVSPYIEIVSGHSLNVISTTTSALAVALIYSLAVGHLIFLASKRHISTAELKYLVSFLVVNVGLHLLLDFVVAFSIYFIFFHSFNAFQHQFCLAGGA